MNDDQKYVVDSLRTTGIGLIVSGIVGAFFGKASITVCVIVMATGVAILMMGFYYVRRRLK